MLSIIIVSYQNVQVLRNCLDSIKKFNDIGDGLEVIVSDNSLDNQLYDTIINGYKWVTIIKNDNIGFGAGNNRGFNVSQGDVLLFLNPDTVLVEPIFDFAIKQFQKYDSLALFGVQLRKEDGAKNSSFFTIDSYSPIAGIKEKLCRKIGLFREKKMFISGANLFVRRLAFEQAGLFDENIFMYLEEADLIKRIKLYSETKRIRFFKEKSIIHLEGGTQDPGLESKINMHKRLISSEIYYSEKWNLKNRPLRERRKYQKFKLNIYRICLKRKSIKDQKMIVAVYDEAIKNLKGRK